MPASLNKVMIIGNVGQAPEMRYTANGSAVTTFSVAANESFTDRAGNKQERTEWFSVVCWNKLAELCSQYVDKGRQVFVEGRLQTRSWEKDGEKHYRTEVVAENVRFLGSGGGNDHAPADNYPEDELPF